MIAARALFGVAMIEVVFNSPVLADRTSRTVYPCGGAVRSDVIRAHLGVNHRRYVAWVHWLVADLRNVVGRAASDHPTRVHLVELNVVSTTVLFDSEADYYRQGGGILDEDHHLLVAQRLHYKLRKRGAYTVRGRDRQELTAGRRAAIRAIVAPMPEPKGRVPTVPAPPKEISGQLAVN